MGSRIQQPPSTRQVTLAFHFQYILPGEWTNQFKLGATLFTRVLRVVRPHLAETGSLLFRMGHLLAAMDKGGPGEFALRDSYVNTMKQRYCSGTQKVLTENLVPLDRIWVITVSGRLHGLQKLWSTRLNHYKRNPFLYSLDVDVGNRVQEVNYLKRSTVVGELHKDWRLTREFSSIEFEPYLTDMLARMRVVDNANKMVSTLLSLIDDREPLPKT